MDARADAKVFPLLAKAIIFDLDGTLLDTLPDLARSANLMLAELGLPEVEGPRVRAYIGDGAVRLVKRVLTGDWEREPERALFDRAMPIFNRHYAEGVARESRPFPGVVEGLEAFRERGFPMGCITNKPEMFTLPLLEQTGLAPYFDIVVSGDVLPRKKPDPMPITYACGFFAARPEHVVLIGDSGNDRESAHAAGCPALGVTYGYIPGGDVRSLGFDAIVDSFEEALTLVKKS
jgi:phosphoglycolate phosphatase